MFHRPHTTICREGWYYLLITAIVFAGAMVKEVNLLLVLAGMMMGLVLFHWQALFVSLKGLKLQRKAPQAVCAGDLLAVSLALEQYPAALRLVGPLLSRNRSSASPTRWNRITTTTITIIGTTTTSRSATSVFFPYIPAGEERTGTYRGRLVQRGRYRLGPMRISTSISLWAVLPQDHNRPERDALRVSQVGPAHSDAGSPGIERHWPGPTGGSAGPGPEGDFYGVREWRSGDSLRLIHWRSSARTGKFVVRQFEQPHNRDVAILLDLWLPENPSTPGDENVELAISFAATVLTDLCRQGGGKVHLGVYDQQPQCSGRPGLGRAVARHDENASRARTRQRRSSSGAYRTPAGRYRLGHGDRSHFDPPGGSIR